MAGQQPISIDTFNLAELKAIAYDQIRILQQAQANLNLLEQRIAQLSQSETPDGRPEREVEGT